MFFPHASREQNKNLIFLNLCFCFVCDFCVGKKTEDRGRSLRHHSGTRLSGVHYSPVRRRSPRSCPLRVPLRSGRRRREGAEQFWKCGNLITTTFMHEGREEKVRTRQNSKREGKMQRWLKGGTVRVFPVEPRGNRHETDDENC